MEKVTLTKVYKTDIDKKTGNKLSFISKKDGSAVFFTRIAILTKEHGDTWITGMFVEENDPRNSWKEGEKVIIDIEKKGDFVNFKLPGKMDILETRLNEIDSRLKKLEKPNNDDFGDDIQIEHIPF